MTTTKSSLLTLATISQTSKPMHCMHMNPIIAKQTLSQMQNYKWASAWEINDLMRTHIRRYSNMEIIGDVVLLFGLIVACFTARGCSQQAQPQQPQVPCFFIFGDSLVDNGNNNGMLTLARANYRPYGIDFPQGTTGRFTNGRTYVDALAQLMGFPRYIPPYSRARGPELLRGVNYASGAAGIRDETGDNLGAHTSMNGQVANFANTVLQMRRLFRGDTNALSSYLSKCIFYCGLGSNDYLNNYFMPPFYSTSSDFTPKAYAAALVQDYIRQLTQLHSLGARKVIVTAVGPIGCIPYQLARYHGNSSRCNEDINKAILLFNTWLRKLVDRFNAGQLQGAKFVYLDSYKSSNDLYQNGTAYGFEVIDKGCCGVGRNNGQITCLPLQQPCNDRRKYLFWDAFHPTELANFIFAQASYGSPSYTYPMNIQQLATL